MQLIVLNWSLKRSYNRTDMCNILDRRTPTPDDAVPPEDIIGAVEIQNGQMLRFHGSPNYRILTDQGLMQLDNWLKDSLIEELITIVNSKSESSSE